ncbi:hypothetical protein [Streptomyces albidoflavus]|uniref:hypothetical protein n=1 Tax=Streptomyces albidoflavus TaxID=1886 RepID=UPI001020594D|nr:hypothetical protein [Streptomyces albidoflavus]RZF02966.1 hypothetical protein C0R05_32275 [Streptomyces albidoflavus]
MSRVIRRTPEQLRAQRAALLAEVHMTHDELRERARVYAVSERQLMVWHTIEGIDYLLDGTSDQS